MLRFELDQNTDLNLASIPCRSCAQRVHQNTLENLTGFAFLTLFNGLFFPRLTAAISATWVLSRIPYAIGYYSGTPSKRAFGGILSGLSYLGMFIFLKPFSIFRPTPRTLCCSLLTISHDVVLICFRNRDGCAMYRLAHYGHLCYILHCWSRKQHCRHFRLGRLRSPGTIEPLLSGVA